MEKPTITPEQLLQEQRNTQILEGILTKYPNAFRVETATDGSKVAWIQAIPEKGKPNNQTIIASAIHLETQLIILSKEGLTVYPTSNDFSIREKEAVNPVTVVEQIRQTPITQGRLYATRGYMLSGRNHQMDEIIVHNYPNGLETFTAEVGLESVRLGLAEVFKRAQEQDFAHFHEETPTPPSEPPSVESIIDSY